MTLVHRIGRLGLLAATLVVAALAVSPVLAATIGVSIEDKQFTPAEIVVHQGDTVTWTVTKAIGEPHTVTSGKSGDADKGALFDSQKTDADFTKLKEAGGTFSFTFNKAGTYAYFCGVHPTMIGSVVVLAPGETPAASEGGVPTQNKLIGAAILVITLVVLFGAAAVYRRMNPA